MSVRKTALFCVAVLACLILSSCYEDHFFKASPLPFTIPIRIQIEDENQDNGRMMYAEVDSELVQEYHLSVESCEGLEKVGEVDGLYRDKHTTVVNGNEETDVVVSIGKDVYAYPDPRYPNLIVALEDGEPVVFQFCNFLDNYTAELETVFGSFSPDTIDSIDLRVTHRENSGYGSEVTISDKQDLTAFCDAYHAEPAAYEVTSAELGEPEDNLDYPYYSVRINLTNGFSVNLLVYPRKHAIDCAFRWYPCSEQLREWFEAHAK